jgi:hypothetical protein
MGTTMCLEDAIAQTHDGLAERLQTARAVEARPDHSVRGCPPIDLFLSAASRHVHAVDEVLLPTAKRCHDGKHLIHDYCSSLRGFEVALAHAKAHEYGSTWEKGYDWHGVWAEIDTDLHTYREHEEQLGVELTETLSDADLERITLRLAAFEEHAPSRPHPYLPHTGAPGWTSRRVMRVVDGFWDAVEGRFTPEAPAPPHKKPGLIGQYLMADPRFDEEEEATDS